nr:hypothetical protein CFP56_60291 [Quercus suber]
MYTCLLDSAVLFALDSPVTGSACQNPLYLKPAQKVPYGVQRHAGGSLSRHASCGMGPGGSTTSEVKVLASILQASNLDIPRHEHTKSWQMVHLIVLLNRKQVLLSSPSYCRANAIIMVEGFYRPCGSFPFLPFASHFFLLFAAYTKSLVILLRSWPSTRCLFRSRVPEDINTHTARSKMGCCNKNARHHCQKQRWPTSGTLYVARCEKTCDYCGDGHVFAHAFNVRRHVTVVHAGKGAYANLDVSTQP